MLCPALLRIQTASCDTLSNTSSLTSLISSELPVLQADPNPRRDVKPSGAAFTGLYMPGIVHPAFELAKLFIHLAADRKFPTQGMTRFVSTNSNNGWVACIAGVYLQRARGAEFHGLAVNSLKTEWATSRNVRLMLMQTNISWRVNKAFDGEADAALMTYHPHVRNSLTPTAFAPARTLLPVAWRGRPPPFDVCFRMGDFDAEATAGDIQVLGGWCRTFVYHGSRAELLYGNLSRVVSAAKGSGAYHLHTRNTIEAGSFTIVHSAPPRDPVEDFVFVNKTPPARPEFYRPACIEDMAPCNWHKEA